MVALSLLAVATEVIHVGQQQFLCQVLRSPRTVLTGLLVDGHLAGLMRTDHVKCHYARALAGNTHIQISSSS